jgi:hypothetical protein
LIATRLRPEDASMTDWMIGKAKGKKQKAIFNARSCGKFKRRFSCFFLFALCLLLFKKSHRKHQAFYNKLFYLLAKSLQLHSPLPQALLHLRRQHEGTMNLDCTMKRDSAKGFYRALIIWINDTNFVANNGLSQTQAKFGSPCC